MLLTPGWSVKRGFTARRRPSTCYGEESAGERRRGLSPRPGHRPEHARPSPSAAIAGPPGASRTSSLPGDVRVEERLRASPPTTSTRSTSSELRRVPQRPLPAVDRLRAAQLRRGRPHRAARRRELRRRPAEPRRPRPRRRTCCSACPSSTSRCCRRRRRGSSGSCPSLDVAVRRTSARDGRAGNDGRSATPASTACSMRGERGPRRARSAGQRARPRTRTTSRTRRRHRGRRPLRGRRAARRIEGQRGSLTPRLAAAVPARRTSPSCIRRSAGRRRSTTATRPASSSAASRPRAWSCARACAGATATALTHLLEPRIGYALVSRRRGSPANPLFVPRAAVEQQRLRELDLDNVTRDPADRIPEFNGVTAGRRQSLLGQARRGGRRRASWATRRSRRSTTSRTTTSGWIAARRARVSVRAHHAARDTSASIRSRRRSPRRCSRSRRPSRRAPRRAALPLPARHPALLRGLSLRARALRPREDRFRPRQSDRSLPALLDHRQLGGHLPGLLLVRARAGAAQSRRDRVLLEVSLLGGAPRDRAGPRAAACSSTCSTRSRGSATTASGPSSPPGCRASACLTALEPFDNNLKLRGFLRGEPAAVGSPGAELLRPSQELFEELATRGNLIPVVREILADHDTPLSLFRRLDDGRTSFLFESVEGGEKWARYSFIGTGARAVFRARGRDVEWSEGGRTQRFVATGDPLEKLREELAALRAGDASGCRRCRASSAARSAWSATTGCASSSASRREPRRGGSARSLVPPAGDDGRLRQRAPVGAADPPREGRGRAPISARSTARPSPRSTRRRAACASRCAQEPRASRCARRWTCAAARRARRSTRW